MTLSHRIKFLLAKLTGKVARYKSVDLSWKKEQKPQFVDSIQAKKLELEEAALKEVNPLKRKEIDEKYQQLEKTEILLRHGK